MHVYEYVYACLCSMYMHMCTPKHGCLSAYVCIFVNMCVSSGIYKYIYTNVHICVEELCIRICTVTCVFTCTCIML